MGGGHVDVQGVKAVARRYRHAIHILTMAHRDDEFNSDASSKQLIGFTGVEVERSE